MKKILANHLHLLEMRADGSAVYMYEGRIITLKKDLAWQVQVAAANSPLPKEVPDEVARLIGGGKDESD